MKQYYKNKFFLFYLSIITIFTESINNSNQCKHVKERYIYIFFSFLTYCLLFYRLYFY